MEQPASPKLLDLALQAIRIKHYSCCTEQAYVDRALYTISKKAAFTNRQVGFT